MEIFDNDFTVTFTNKTAAKKAKQIAADTLNAMTIDGYVSNPAKETAAELHVEGKALSSDATAFDAHDFMEAAVNVVKAIAAKLSDESFTFNCVGTDTYSESWVEGSLENGVLTIDTTYFPEGYGELFCPECGEFVIEMEEYDPSESYICPECGEEIDFSDQAPIKSHEIIKIK